MLLPDSCRQFWAANLRLWRDAEAGLSLAATTIFWGVGATLQFAVLRWAQERLALPLDQAAYLQAAVAVGVVLGAWAAGRWVALRHAPRMLWAGVALGLLMPLLAQVQALPMAAGLLLAVGMVGGAMVVVPLNALLQHRGHQLLAAGSSIAVQGFNENLSVLVMLGVYALCLHQGWTSSACCAASACWWPRRWVPCCCAHAGAAARGGQDWLSRI